MVAAPSSHYHSMLLHALAVWNYYVATQKSDASLLPIERGAVVWGCQRGIEF